MQLDAYQISSHGLDMIQVRRRLLGAMGYAAERTPHNAEVAEVTIWSYPDPMVVIYEAIATAVKPLVL